MLFLHPEINPPGAASSLEGQDSPRADLQATDSGPLSTEAYADTMQKRGDKVQIVLSSTLVIPK